MSNLNTCVAGDQTPAIRRRHGLVLAGINALYVGFGMVMGVVNGGLPTVMRAQGIDISTAGWLYLLYLPFGLTFLWAPLIDRVRLPFLSRRVGWIVSMQLLAVLGLVVVAFNEGAAPLALFALGFAIVVAIATMDIALDALAVRLVAPDWRSTASATKLAALAGGSMIGGGVFIALAGDLGWQTTFLILGAVLVLLVCPVLVLGKQEGLAEDIRDTGNVQAGASLLRLLRDRSSCIRLVLLTVACCIMFPLVGLNRLMLVDIGVPVAEIGWIVGTLGPVSMLATSAASVALMRYLGLVHAMLVFACLAFGALVAMVIGYHLESHLIAIVGAVAIGAGVSGIYVALATKILGWAAGDQPATDYAAYYGISRFASTLMTVAATQIVPLVTWGLFYGAGAIALIVTVLFLFTLLGKND
ncbi:MULTISPECIES: MFS transporter [Thalassospira]|uniref:MFS transporter n=1 Tax=Thalassospira aquimaris TaxID=3037796 RepID=A0ABT6G7Q3_9PROT|nr:MULTISPECIES: MFS transporter [Thalassospira]MDG4718054.1 MFS transporter [Thalassospira sp. FZY0004]